MAESQPLVSVVIPAYNAEHYIAQAIDSVLAQTYNNIEILVAYRDSADNTRSAIESYLAAGKIILVHQSGKGLSNGRNVAIARARGEFIAFLDVDDLFLPEKIAKQVDYLLAHPKCDACYVGIRHFRDDDVATLLQLNYVYYSGDDVLPNLLRKSFIAPSTVMVRRKTIDRIGLFDETLRRSEDWEYWARLVQRGAVFCFIPEFLAKIRLHADSMSSGWNSKREERETNIKILNGLRARMPVEERRRVGIDRAIFRQRAQLWYIYVGNYVPPLQWLHQWIQQRRFQ
jgi:glycosyltransferase involved in cell wall biosynthesis